MHSSTMRTTRFGGHHWMSTLGKGFTASVGGGVVSPMDIMTHAYKNITFLQHRWRVVMMLCSVYHRRIRCMACLRNTQFIFTSTKLKFTDVNEKGKYP